MIRMISESQVSLKKIELSETIPPFSVFQKDDNWLIKEKVRYCVELKNQWVIVEMPKGFTVEFNQITYHFPLLTRWISNRTIVAAVFHYVLYKEGYDRKIADNAFLRAMELERIKFYHRYPLYWSARLFGGLKYLHVLKHNMA
ncbi:MAG TPA: DUF1353 domain-containing protein [Cellvibrio sp.]|nr:DUF1353 domain-containing protein [Cellvibrio sp.]